MVSSDSQDPPPPFLQSPPSSVSLEDGQLALGDTTSLSLCF